MPGSPEVDFQQSTTLAAHWEGFFDKESGVAFYESTFGSKCWNGERSTEMVL